MSFERHLDSPLLLPDICFFHDFLRILFDIQHTLAILLGPTRTFTWNVELQNIFGLGSEPERVRIIKGDSRKTHWTRNTQILQKSRLLIGSQDTARKSVLLVLHDIELQLLQMEELNAVADLLSHPFADQLGRWRWRNQNERTGLMGFHIVIQNRTIRGTTWRHDDNLDRTNGLLARCHRGYRRIQLPTTENLRESLNCLSLHYLRSVRILSFHFTNEASELRKSSLDFLGILCRYRGILVLGHHRAFCSAVH